MNNFLLLLSGHLFKWSDYNETFFYLLFKAKTQKAYATTRKIRISNTARLFDRTLQKMWQKKLQMLQGKRPWTKILFIDYIIKKQSCYNLCTYRIQNNSKTGYLKLSKSKRDLGTVEQCQSSITCQKKFGVISITLLIYLKKPP